MTDWAKRMGEDHERRDLANEVRAQSQADLERERHAACVQRWPTIVAAMRTLVAGYNEGTGLSTLTIVEDPLNPGVTVSSSRRGHSSLVIVLDGADVSVHTHDGRGSQVDGPRWVSLDRTDEGAAEYLLRNWMEQL